MDGTLTIQALVLGVIEGLTEFLPVSSTGHLILAGDLLGFDGPVNTIFYVVIQLGAILAVVVAYFQRLTHAVLTMASEPASRRLVLAIILAFLPSAVIGYVAHDFIKGVLFSPWVVSVALILGGIAILMIEPRLPPPKVHRVEDFSAALALKIGGWQLMSMIPGVSRAGATIVGSLLMGVDRRAAAEFSFFLAIPTMLGASVLDLYKSQGMLTRDDALVIAVGFAAAFISALIVVKTMIGFVGRYGFAPFAWYRIIIGTVMIALLSFSG
jgi:undecaprenyl-diphosphatase